MFEGFLYSIFGLLILLGVLVTFHEWGHYWVAKKLGVKAVRFSVGFGKPFWKRVAKDGTEFAIAPIPLGGYVKFVDEREGDVSEQDLPYAFNRQPLWKRTSIVLAGPMANFLLAIIVYSITFMMGYDVAKPYVYSVKEGSIAAQSNFPERSEIISVNGEETQNFQDVVFALFSELGDQNVIDVEVLPDSASTSKVVQLDLSNWNEKQAEKALDVLGLEQGYKGSTFTLAKVLEGGSAKASGLQANDQIISLDYQPMDGFEIREYLQKHPDTKVAATIIRAGSEQDISLQIGHQAENPEIGFIGVQGGISASKDTFRTLQAGFFEGIVLGSEKTWQVVTITSKFLAKFVTGKLSVDNLGGPVSIARGAGQTVQAGIVDFLLFLAMISVNLGFVNLLPIPMLDGGHLMYYLAEFVRGKPVSEKIMELGMRIGIILVLSIMAIALINDINRI